MNYAEVSNLQRQLVCLSVHGAESRYRPPIPELLYKVVRAPRDHHLSDGGGEDGRGGGRLRRGWRGDFSR